MPPDSPPAAVPAPDIPTSAPPSLTALFVAFAPVGAPRYACAVVVEHGGVEAAGGSAVAAPICRDVLLEVQKRDPARRVPQPDSVAQGPVPVAPPLPEQPTGQIHG